MFDIHTYGRELLVKLEELGGVDHPVLFCDAVANHPPFEICRYFLAGLQLVCKLSSSCMSSLHGETVKNHMSLLIMSVSNLLYSSITCMTVRF